MKKGDKVWMIKSYDCKGTFAYSPWVIRSAGPKQVYLVSDDGQNLQHKLWRGQNNYSSADLVLFSRDIDPAAKALELAAAFLPVERARLEGCIARNADDTGYCDVMRRNIEALHEPRAIIRP